VLALSSVPAGAWSTTVQVKPVSTVYVSEQPSPLGGVAVAWSQKQPRHAQETVLAAGRRFK